MANQADTIRPASIALFGTVLKTRDGKGCIYDYDANDGADCSVSVWDLPTWSIDGHYWYSRRG